tara:strand:+ start:130 stop:858 length:729 start_codon:yes stop_codon:yes gene_type:complete
MNNNKTAIITGAGTGIGRGIALKFAENNFNLILASRNVDNLNKVKKDCDLLNNDSSYVIQTDITDEKSVDNLFSESKSRFGKIDVLINNSGVFDGGAIDEMSVETWDKVISVNLRGAFLCLRQAMKLMKSQKYGRIVNIGSISGQVPRLNSVPYTTSKFGLTGLTKAAALEGRDFNVVVSIVHPGNVITELRGNRGEDKDIEPMMEPQDIAELVFLTVNLPSNVNLLESVMLPNTQLYVGRG